MSRGGRGVRDAISAAPSSAPIPGWDDPYRARSGRWSPATPTSTGMRAHDEGPRARDVAASGRPPHAAVDGRGLHRREDAAGKAVCNKMWRFMAQLRPAAHADAGGAAVPRAHAGAGDHRRPHGAASPSGSAFTFPMQHDRSARRHHPGGLHRGRPAGRPADRRPPSRRPDRARAPPAPSNAPGRGHTNGPRCSTSSAFNHCSFSHTNAEERYMNRIDRTRLDRRVCCVAWRRRSPALRLAQSARRTRWSSSRRWGRTASTPWCPPPTTTAAWSSGRPTTGW